MTAPTVHPFPVWRTLVAMGLIAALTYVAELHGHNTWTNGLAIAAISGLAGYPIGHYITSFFGRKGA